MASVCSSLGVCLQLRHACHAINFTYQTTSGADGKVIAWDVSADEPIIETTLEGIIPAVSDPEYVVCKERWNKSH